MSEAWDRLSDEGLLERMRNGDESAFLQLYQRHRDPTFRFAYRMLGSPEQAEDVTHDCFLSLIRNPHHFDPRRGSLRNYLYGAARNLAHKCLRRSGNEVGDQEYSSAAPVNGNEQPLGHLLAQELSGKVRQALTRIPPLQREVVVLSEYEEQNLEDIASIVGVPIGTVKSRLFRGRECLRKELAPYLNGAGGRQIAKSGQKEKSDHE